MGFRHGGTEKTHAPDGSKTLSQLAREHAEWREGQSMVTRCGLEGCSWLHDGTVASCREAAAAHRSSAHPKLAKPRTRRQVEDDQRREKKQAADAAAAAEQERRRQVRALQAMDDGLPQEPPANPEPKRTQPSSHRSHGMRWTRASAIAAVRTAAEALGHPPGCRDFRERKDLPLPSSPTASKLFGSWGGMIEAAGFERPTRATRYSEPAAVGDPAVTGSADAVTSTGDDEAASQSAAESLPVQLSGSEYVARIEAFRHALIAVRDGLGMVTRAVDELGVFLEGLDEAA